MVMLISRPFIPQEFDEVNYLRLNPDVEQAVQRKAFSSGWAHFLEFGINEIRPGVSPEFKTKVLKILQDTRLMPPESLHNIGAGDYVLVGNELLGLMVCEARMQPEDRILDIGCGTGRVARVLTNYLTSGSYDGIDIVKPSIEWCQDSYKDYPNFHFHFSDIYNSLYNPEGKIEADDYHFPFEDESFDFIFLTSVFTHMLFPAVENYLAEISRLLTTKGKVFSTFFLLTPEARKNIEKGVAHYNFSHRVENCFAENPEAVEYAVAYEEETIRESFHKYGLNILEPIRYGAWNNKQYRIGLSFLDVIIANKR
jgi:SAM-dependent methyltransferase